MIDHIINTLRWIQDVDEGNVIETTGWTGSYLSLEGDISTAELDFICAICNLIVLFSKITFRVAWVAGEIRPIDTKNKILWIDKSLLRDVLHQSKILGLRGGSPKNN